jgi:hypothetical protein
MFFTWMMAAQMWSQREDVVDPFREAASNLVMPFVTYPLNDAMPKEPRALVA